MLKMGIIVGFVGAAVISVAADTPQAGLPNSFLTPGNTNKVTKEQVCAADFTSTVKPIKDSMKEEAFGRYGLRVERAEGDVLDYLVPPELGGSNDIENLWPEPVRGEWSAARKDALEQKLHSMVCDGTLTLKQAQTALKKNWVAAYTQYVGTATAHGQ
jgi:hypothetical protein